MCMCVRVCVLVVVDLADVGQHDGGGGARDGLCQSPFTRGVV